MKVYTTEHEAEETIDRIRGGAYPGTAAAYILLSRIMEDLPGTEAAERARECREGLFKET